MSKIKRITVYKKRTNTKEVINANLLDAKVDAALTALVDYQNQVSTSRTLVGTLKTTASTKKTTATATTAEIRTIYAGVETVCTQLDAMLQAQDKTAKALAVALRLLTGRLEDTTGT